MDEMIVQFASIILVFVMIIVLPLIIAVWWRWIRKRIKIRIVGKHGESFRIVKKASKPLGTETFEFNKNKYLLDTKNSILDNRDNPILYFKSGHLAPLKFNPIGDNMNSGMLKRILESNSYGKMLGSYRDDIFLVIILGIFVFAIITMGFQQYTIHNQGLRIKELSQLLYNATNSGDVFIPQ